MKLTRSILQPNRYEYLSVEDSELYDHVKYSTEDKDMAIKRLIEHKAGSSKAMHCMANFWGGRE